MKWHEINIGTIISGKTTDGVPYLKLFLIDYKSEFHVETVNPSCRKCLNSYHAKFIKKYSNMENTSKYKLHKKREGLQLKFGSPIHVTNKNITDAYAKQLIKRFKALQKDFELSYLFDEFPVQEIEVKEVKEVKPIKRKARTSKK